MSKTPVTKTFVENLLRDVKKAKRGTDQSLTNAKNQAAKKLGYSSWREMELATTKTLSRYLCVPAYLLTSTDEIRAFKLLAAELSAILAPCLSYADYHVDLFKLAEEGFVPDSKESLRDRLSDLRDARIPKTSRLFSGHSHVFHRECDVFLFLPHGKYVTPILGELIGQCKLKTRTKASGKALELHSAVVSSRGLKPTKIFAEIDWEKTDCSVDMHCECGNRSHFDVYGLHFVQCKKCEKKYAIGTILEGAMSEGKSGDYLNSTEWTLYKRNNERRKTTKKTSASFQWKGTAAEMTIQCSCGKTFAPENEILFGHFPCPHCKREVALDMGIDVIELTPEEAIQLSEKDCHTDLGDDFDAAYDL